MKKTINFFAFLFALILVCTYMLTGCNHNSGDDFEETVVDDESGSSVSENLLALTSNGEALYCVVYDPKGVEGANKLANQLVEKMMELTEHQITFRRYSSNNIASTAGYKHMYVGAVIGYTDDT